jgi:putative ABC transport system permease protein
VRERLSHGARVTAAGGLRNVLAVAEIAMALVLLTGAGLMMNSLWRIHRVDSGFQPDRVLTMTVDLPAAVYREAPDMKAFHGRLLEKLGSIPRISSAAAVSGLPASRFLIRGDATLRDRRFPSGYGVDKLVVSAGYFRTMGIRIAAGRDFTAADTAEAPGVAMVSRSAAQAIWPGEDPLGKQISESERPTAKDWYTVVGVVDDVRQEGPTARPDGALYFSYAQTPHNGWLSHMSYVVRAAPASPPPATAMRAAIANVDADVPAGRIVSMENVVDAVGAARTFQARLLAAFALMAVALAIIGVYGVLAYAVTARTREIGIRMALGARSGHVVGMVMRRTLLLGAAGLALGTAGALFSTRVLDKMLYEVKPNDAATIVGVAALLGAVTLAAGFIPARRASRVDPLVVLRWE